jgi:hypothetical protein
MKKCGSIVIRKELAFGIKQYKIVHYGGQVKIRDKDISNKIPDLRI